MRSQFWMTLALACVALAMNGCKNDTKTGNTGTTSPVTPPAIFSSSAVDWKQVRFVILWDTDTEAKATPEHHHLSKGNKDTVIWVNLTGTPKTLTFGNGTPFEGGATTVSVPAWGASDEFKIATATAADPTKSYPYEVTPTPKPETPPSTPDVIVED